MSIRICLDAGHYGKYNRSPALKTYYESEMNWKLHNYLKAELETYNDVEVIVTRTNQSKDMSLIERGKASKGCDLLLSEHSNAVGGNGVNEDIDYPVAYVSINGKGNKLGGLLAECVRKTMGTKQSAQVQSRKGTWGNYDWYSLINGAVQVGTTAIILEHSFHTNTKMATWLSNDNNLKKMAQAEAKVIADYFGVKKTAPVTPEPAPTPKPTPAPTPTPSTTNAVLEWQKAAIKDGFTFPKYGADGKWGSECESVAKKAIVKKRIIYKYKNLTKIVQKAVGTTVDGLCGKNTTTAIKEYQKKNGLTADGCVGLNTWKKILKIK